MSYIVCPGCRRSVEPSERVERDKKTGKTYKITFCPFDRCNRNIDLEQIQVKLWNKKTMEFEDYLP